MAHFWLREYRLVGRNRDVRRKLAPKSRSQGPAVDRRDDRLAQPPHMRPFPGLALIAALPLLDELGMRLALRVGIAPAAAPRRTLIAARAEGAPGASKDDHLDRAVGIGLVEGAMQLALEAAR